MTKNMKILLCLFILGTLLGACGRKFRAINENGAIEGKATLIANQKFAQFFDTPQEYQDHLQLKSELLAVEFSANSQVRELGVGVVEKDCATRSTGRGAYTDEALFQSAAESPIVIPGNESYGFYASCIPTQVNGATQCQHFLLAIQKRYAEGRIGTVLTVMAFEKASGSWVNLPMSEQFLYTGSFKTLKQVGTSLSCATGPTTPFTGVPAPTNTGGSGGSPDSPGEQLVDAVIDWGLDAGGDWLTDYFNDIINGDDESEPPYESPEGDQSVDPFFDFGTDNNDGGDPFEDDDTWTPIDGDSDFWLN